MVMLIVLGLAGLSSSPASASGPDQYGNFTYSYKFQTAIPSEIAAKTTIPQVMAEIQRNFLRYFPFDSDCKTLPPAGSTCNLYERNVKIPVPNPVYVLYVNPTGFKLKSLPGHFEGPNRFISFTFTKESPVGYSFVYLSVKSEGRWSQASEITYYSGLAQRYWQSFASAVGK